MSIASPEPRTHADLWNASSRWDQAKAIVRANRLNELASLGVDVTDSDKLRAAYDDRYLMARLAGREMRRARELAGPAPANTPPYDHAEGLRVARANLAASMRAAEERYAVEGDRPPREMLL